MDLPILSFIQERLEEADPNFDTRNGTAFFDLFIKPQELIIQPFMDAMDQVLIAQSIRRILQQDDPNSFDQSLVDDLVANLYVYRDNGAYAAGMVRAYYETPLAKQYPALTAEVTSTAGSYFNTTDISITADQMALQTDGSLFYLDFFVQAQNPGDSYNADPGDITSFINDPDAVRVTNLAALEGGLPQESNIDLLDRAADSIAVRDLETTKGINAILNSKFPFIQAIQAIGMGDPEMMRDIVYNVHVGGKTDVYIKVPQLTVASSDFIGLTYDTTREIPRNVHRMMARSIDDDTYPADLGTPNIAAGSLTVREDIIETSAFIDSVIIPPGVGVDLSTAGWIRLQIDDLPSKQIKISGATPTSTQRFEIINSINSSLGFNVATAIDGNKMRVSSLKTGQYSSVTLEVIQAPVAPTQNASMALFNIPVNTLPVTFDGVAADVYVPDIDYTVDEINGAIYQTAFNPSGRSAETITSGQMMITNAVDASFVLDTGVYYFDTSTIDGFLNPGGNGTIHVRPGDEVTISRINGFVTGTVIGDLPQTFIVAKVVDSERLLLSGLNPSAPAATDTVQYSIKSNQVVVIDYTYNPISIDVGAQVLLEDGYNRGIRPGRSDFTIQNTPIADIVSIQEIDPDTLELIGDPLALPGGYGKGGYGKGGYGQGLSGDYQVLVNNAPDRFSVFDDMVILFTDLALSLSYRVTYRWAPEIGPIHTLSRTDTERVTGADVLPKIFVPALVDMTIGIRRDPTNINTPDDDALAQMVSDLVNTTNGVKGVEASDIAKLLEDQGVDSVQIPFTMTANVINTDGTTSIIQSTDILKTPDVTLPRQTDNYVTPRITHFYPNNITVVEVP